MIDDVAVPVEAIAEATLSGAIVVSLAVALMMLLPAGLLRRWRHVRRRGRGRFRWQPELCTMRAWQEKRSGAESKIIKTNLHAINLTIAPWNEPTSVGVELIKNESINSGSEDEKPGYQIKGAEGIMGGKRGENPAHLG